MPEYIPSPKKWVADQVELYEGTDGREGTTLRETGLPVIIVTNTGHKRKAIRKTPLMRIADGQNYVLVASQGGAPTHPLWYHNLKANPNVEIRDEENVYKMRKCTPIFHLTLTYEIVYSFAITLKASG